MISSADLWAALLFFAFHGTAGLRDREKKNAVFSKARN